MKRAVIAVVAAAAAAAAAVQAQFNSYDIASGAAAVAGSYTGTSVSSSGQVIAIGAPYYDVWGLNGGGASTPLTAGNVLFYVCNPIAQNVNNFACSQTTTITAGSAGAGYGASVGISRAGALVAVGCPFCTIGGMCVLFLMKIF